MAGGAKVNCRKWSGGSWSMTMNFKRVGSLPTKKFIWKYVCSAWICFVCKVMSHMPDHQLQCDRII